MKKLWVLICSSFLMAPSVSNSAQVDVQVNASLMQSLSINNVINMNFGGLEYDTNDPGGAISLGNDGAVAVGSTGYESVSSGTPGSFSISSTVGEILIISCNSTGTLTNSTDPTKLLTLFSINYAVNGTTSLCTGVGSSFSAVGSDSISIGGILQVPAGTIASEGMYSTQNTGGVPISFSVTYQ